MERPVQTGSAYCYLGSPSPCAYTIQLSFSIGSVSYTVLDENGNHDGKEPNGKCFAQS